MHHASPRIPLLALLSLGLLCPALGRAEVKVGAELQAPTIRDADDNPAQIPELGNKVLLVMYTDPDVADQNDPFADMLKAADLPKEFYKSVGVANMKDAPAKPNWIIRAIVRKKVKKYGSTILTDPDRLLAKAWDLGDCNEKSVVLVFGKDKRLAYFKKGALSPAEQQEALGKIRELIAKAQGK